ncbi:hypothetical protein KI387_022217, partial [Taxus chinensis]
FLGFLANSESNFHIKFDHVMLALRMGSKSIAADLQKGIHERKQACEHGHVEVAKLLVEATPNYMIFQPNNNLKEMQ